MTGNWNAIGKPWTGKQRRWTGGTEMTGHTSIHTDLYEQIKAVTKPDEIGHWCSDLQCKVTPATRSIAKQYTGKKTLFRSQIDGTLWYEFPFMYTPWWEGEREI